MWVVLLAIGGVLSVTLLGDALTTDITIANNPESKRASDLVKQRLGDTNTTVNEMVIVRSPSFTVDAPEFETYVNNLSASLIALGTDVVAGGVNYYATGSPTLVSADKHATLISLSIPRSGIDDIGKVHAALDAASAGSGFETNIIGPATMEHDYMAIGESDARRGEMIGASAALVVLAIVFGALVAALLPIALAGAAIVLALGATALVGQAVDLIFMVTNMITMMGLAVGIDYSLFVVSRYREERAAGMAKQDAIARAASTASKAVLFSGMTVVLALCGLLIFPLSIFRAMGAGSILVVASAVLACLTLLPAILGLVGDRVDTVRVRLPIGRRRTGGAAGQGGIWAWTAGIVMRYPAVFAVSAAALLVAIASPFLDMEKGFAGVSTIPDGTRSKAGYEALATSFGYGQDSPATVVIDSKAGQDVLAPAVERLRASLANDPEFIFAGVDAHPDAGLTVLSVRLAGDPYSKAGMEAVGRLRTQHVPAAFAGVDADVFVGGATAEALDFNGTTDAYTPIIFAFVLGLSFILLTVAFRSIVVPLASIIMNLLSVGAAYGFLVIVFQRGVGASLLGLERVEMIEPWLPLFLFSILFGLSMDYHVFLLSRIREHFNRTGDNRGSVAFGLQSTGRLITGAALIMVAVFGGFAMGDIVMMQEMGFGLAVAVFMDATVVRTILVPATMRLLGNANWYFPKWLGWVPRVGIGEGESSGAAGGEQAAAPPRVTTPIR